MLSSATANQVATGPHRADAPNGLTGRARSRSKSLQTTTCRPSGSRSSAPDWARIHAAKLHTLGNLITQAYRDARAALARVYTAAGYDPEAAYRAERDAAQQLPPDHQ